MLKVAHNLRAPLGAALSMLELIRGGDLGEVTPAQARHLKRVDERLRTLDQAIGQLLAIARTRDLSREIPDVVVDLEELAQRLRRTFQDEARLRGLAFAVVVTPGLPAVDSGVELLAELLENLVSNAIRYTPEGGEVELRVEPGAPGEVRFTVRDTGIGIPEEEQGKLFQEFYRAPNAKRHCPTGTGLGLALVKQTVERHRGRLALRSAEGQGTTVIVEIPVRRARPAPAPETAPPGAPSS
jgi:signal transduction histidine kinase